MFLPESCLIAWSHKRDTLVLAYFQDGMMYIDALIESLDVDELDPCAKIAKRK